jgi:uncharacterized protein with HEPN domain
MWKDDAIAADILLAARDIQEFAAGITRDEFANDTLVQSAVVFKIIVLGEAAKRLSDEFRLQHPQINWKQVAGMRDRCVHGYDDIDFDIVWQVITDDAPKLEQFLKGIIPQQPSG